MDRKRTSFGTRSGFELAAIGSAVGLGNIWGFHIRQAPTEAQHIFSYISRPRMCWSAARLVCLSCGSR